MAALILFLHLLCGTIFVRVGVAAVLGPTYELVLPEHSTTLKTSVRTTGVLREPAIVPHITIGDQKRKETESTTTNTPLSRDINIPIPGTASYDAEENCESSSGYSQSQVCLAVVIATVAGAITVLLAALLACLCSKRLFKCRRCLNNVPSLREEQAWSESTMAHDRCQPWWLTMSKQQHQQQIPVLHRGQSWSTNTTICNNYNEVVSPMDTQVWDEIQQDYQVSPSSSYMSPVIYPPTQSHIVAQQQPVELPTTADPGNTPLPSYPATMASAHLPPRFSWTEDEEASYRPSSWAKR